MIENIYLKNASCTDVKTALLEIDTDVLYQWRNLVDTRDRRLTTIRNLYLENITVGGANYGILIKGDKDLPVRNISLKNVRVDNVRKEPRISSDVEDLKEDQVVKCIAKAWVPRIRPDKSTDVNVAPLQELQRACRR